MRSTQDIPRLTWLNGKTYPSAQGGRKGNSGHGPEHKAALADHFQYFLEHNVKLTPETPESK